MKRFPLLYGMAIAFLMAAPLARAATVSLMVNSIGGFMFADSSGSLLSLGDTVRVGYFDLNGLTTLQTSNSFTEVNALFTPLGESILDAGFVQQANNTTNALVINNGLGSAGHIFGEIQDIESDYLLNNPRLFVWAFNDANPLAATEWGIFGAATGWEFPMEDGAVVLSTFEIGNTSTEVVRGVYDSGSSQLQLGAVPEPTSLALLAIAGLIHRRRRPAAKL
jgi:hypothetical protein